MKPIYALLLALSLLASSSPEAHAYLDPGTTNILLQTIIGGAATLIATFGLYWGKIKLLLSRGRSKEIDSKHGA